MAVRRLEVYPEVYDELEEENRKALLQPSFVIALLIPIQSQHFGTEWRE